MLRYRVEFSEIHVDEADFDSDLDDEDDFSECLPLSCML